MASGKAHDGCSRQLEHIDFNPGSHCASIKARKRKPPSTDNAGLQCRIQRRPVKGENAAFSGRSLRLLGMTEGSQRYCFIDAPWLGGGCAACASLLIPYVVAGEAIGTT